MRRWLALLLALMLGACAAGPKGPGGEVEVKAVPWLKASDDTYHCGKGPPSKPDYEKCNDIPVIVLLKANGSCLAVMPYGELFVHAERGQVTQVVWRLYAPNGYKFRNNGVTITKRNPGDPDPATYYTNGGPPPHSNSRRFQWTLVKDTPAQFNHDVYVESDTGSSCTSVDPIIRNEAT